MTQSEDEFALTSNTNYALARDLLGMIIAIYTDKIGEEEEYETPNRALIENYEAEMRNCALQRARLHLLDEAANLALIEECRATIQIHYPDDGTSSVQPATAENAERSTPFVCWKCSQDAHSRCYSAPWEPPCACPQCEDGW